MLCVRCSLITYLGHFPLDVISTNDKVTVSNNAWYMPMFSFYRQLQTCFPSELNFTHII